MRKGVWKGRREEASGMDEWQGDKSAGGRKSGRAEVLMSGCAIAFLSDGAESAVRSD